VYVPGFRSAIGIIETPPSETMSPFSSTPLPRMAMSWPSDWGFFERMITGPADADAVDFTKLSPLAATSISTTCPSAPLEAADVAEDAAEDNADEMPPAEGTLGDDVPPEDDPQPAATARAIAAATRTVRLQKGRGDMRLGYPPACRPYTSAQPRRLALRRHPE